MNAYLLALGWWNLVGCGFMLLLLHPKWGPKLMNECVAVLSEPYNVDFYAALWVFWATGLNVFYALINILSVGWEFAPLMRFTAWTDVISYCIFLALGIRTHVRGKAGKGIY